MISSSYFSGLEWTDGTFHYSLDLLIAFDTLAHLRLISLREELSLDDLLRDLLHEAIDSEVGSARRLEAVAADE